MALLENDNPFGNHHFQAPAVCFQGCKFHTLRMFRVPKNKTPQRGQRFRRWSAFASRLTSSVVRGWTFWDVLYENHCGQLKTWFNDKLGFHPNMEYIQNIHKWKPTFWIIILIYNSIFCSFRDGYYIGRAVSKHCLVNDLLNRNIICLMFNLMNKQIEVDPKMSWEPKVPPPRPPQWIRA